MQSSEYWGRNRGIDRGYVKSTRCKTKVRQSETQHEGHGSDEHFNGDDFERECDEYNWKYSNDK